MAIVMAVIEQVDSIICQLMSTITCYKACAVVAD